MGRASILEWPCPAAGRGAPGVGPKPWEHGGSVAALEESEKLEQLRALAAGKKIFADEARESFPAGIDTPDDLQRTIDYLEK